MIGCRLRRLVHLRAGVGGCGSGAGLDALVAVLGQRVGVGRAGGSGGVGQPACCSALAWRQSRPTTTWSCGGKSKCGSTLASASSMTRVVSPTGWPCLRARYRALRWSRRRHEHVGCLVGAGRHGEAPGRTANRGRRRRRRSRILFMALAGRFDGRRVGRPDWVRRRCPRGVRGARPRWRRLHRPGPSGRPTVRQSVVHAFLAAMADLVTGVVRGRSRARRRSGVESAASLRVRSAPSGAERPCHDPRARRRVARRRVMDAERLVPRHLAAGRATASRTCVAEGRHDVGALARPQRPSVWPRSCVMGRPASLAMSSRPSMPR